MTVTRSAAIPAERRAEHARANQALARARALQATGQYREALTTLATIATDIPDAQLLAEVAIERGDCAYMLGDVAAARDYYSGAVARADAAHDDRLRAAALIRTLSLVGNEAVQLAEAGRIEEQARAAVERAGAPVKLAADLAFTMGGIELHRGKPDAAAKSYATALAACRAQQPIDEFWLADILKNAAGAHARMGDYATALKMSEEAAAYAEASVGTNHPLTASIWTSMVEDLYQSGRKADAFAAARRAIAIYQRVFGARHHQLARAPKTSQSSTSRRASSPRPSRYSNVRAPCSRSCSARTMWT